MTAEHHGAQDREPDEVFSAFDKAIPLGRIGTTKGFAGSCHRHASKCA